MAVLITEVLRRRLQSAGSAPLITYYDLGSGERTELSAVTFANWVAKTANLLVDEIGADDGDRVALPLAVSAPGHWLALVWEMACWQVGVAVDLTDPPGEVAVISGPAFEPWVWRDVYACSLHPLGFGFTEPLPSGVHDYALEVRGQPDVYGGPPASADSVAWVDADRMLTQSDLVAESGAPGGRRLVRPGDPWSTCRDALLAAVLSGGSTVIVVGDGVGVDDGDSGRLDQIARTEQVED